MNPIMTVLIAAANATPVPRPAILLDTAILAAAHAPATDTVRLKVEGMTCGGCAISARLVLERLEGVEKAEVDYDRKLAIVQYDAEKVSPQKMIDALKSQLKYTAAVVKKEDQ